MMKKVVWSSKAQKNYRDNLLYLKEFWTKKEIKRFIFLVDKAVHTISQNPYIGSVYEENYRYRKYLVTEQIYLFYRLTQENEILLASFWNNYQNPDQLKEFLL